MTIQEWFKSSECVFTLYVEHLLKCELIDYNMCELNLDWTCMELDWNCIELKWIELNWAELNWIELSWVTWLKTWIILVFASEMDAAGLKHCGLRVSTGPTRADSQSAMFQASFDHFNGENKDQLSVKPSKLSWSELNWIELNLIRNALNWTEVRLNWIELNWVELSYFA